MLISFCADGVYTFRLKQGISNIFALDDDGKQYLELFASRILFSQVGNYDTEVVKHTVAATTVHGSSLDGEGSMLKKNGFKVMFVFLTPTVWEQQLRNVLLPRDRPIGTIQRSRSSLTLSSTKSFRYNIETTDAKFMSSLKRSRRPSSRSSSFRSSSFKPTTIEASTSTDEGTKETQGGQKIIIGMFSLFMISHVNAITITLDGDSDIVVRTSNKKVKPPMASIYYNMWPSQAEEQYFIGTRVDLALNVEIGNEILVGTVMSDQAEDRIPTDISLILSDNKFIFPQNTIGSWMYACEREPVTTEEGIKNWLLSNINTPCSVAIVFKDARGNVVFDLLPSSMIDNGNRILSIEDTKVLLSAHQRYTYILGKRLLEFYDLTVSRKSTLTRFFPGIVGNKDKGKEQLRIHFSKKSDPRMPR